MRGRLIILLFCVAIFCASGINFLQKNAYAKTDVIEINSLDDFLNIKENPSADYILNCDINFNNLLTKNIKYTPFEFSGSIDGKTHKIEYLTLGRDGRKIEKAGLFSILSGAIIKNLTLNCFDIYGTDNGCSGALAGEIINHSTVENVNIILSQFNSIMAGDKGFAGKIAGRVENSTINNVYVAGGRVIGDKKGEFFGENKNGEINLADKLIVFESEESKPEDSTNAGDNEDNGESGDNNENKDPCAPENPIEPSEPEKPTKPTEPDNLTPETPASPVEPSEPENPENPDDLDNSPIENPNEPAEPDNPTLETPENPNEPTNPDKITEPTEPENPPVDDDNLGNGEDDNMPGEPLDPNNNENGSNENSSGVDNNKNYNADAEHKIFVRNVIIITCVCVVAVSSLAVVATLLIVKKIKNKQK